MNNSCYVLLIAAELWLVLRIIIQSSRLANGYYPMRVTFAKGWGTGFIIPKSVVAFSILIKLIICATIVVILSSPDLC